MKPNIQHDLTVAPIRKTDRIVVETEEHRHIFKVLGVVGSPGDRREIAVERISSTDPDMKRRDTLVLHPGQPVMGIVVSEADFDAGDAFEMDAGKVHNAILAQLEQFLMTKEFRKAPFKVCVDMLQNLGLLPRGTYRPIRERLSRLIRANDEIFSSSGTYIELVKKKVSSAASESSAQSAVDRPVEISLFHLNKMIYHGLMSGLFTGGRPVKLVDLDTDA